MQIRLKLCQLEKFAFRFTSWNVCTQAVRELQIKVRHHCSWHTTNFAEFSIESGNRTTIVCAVCSLNCMHSNRCRTFSTWSNPLFLISDNGKNNWKNDTNLFLHRPYRHRHTHIQWSALLSNGCEWFCDYDTKEFKGKTFMTSKKKKSKRREEHRKIMNELMVMIINRRVNWKIYSSTQCQTHTHIERKREREKRREYTLNPSLNTFTQSVYSHSSAISIVWRHSVQYNAHCTPISRESTETERSDSLNTE